jgi:hypothetical protein
MRTLVALIVAVIGCNAQDAPPHERPPSSTVATASAPSALPPTGAETTTGATGETPAPTRAALEPSAPGRIVAIGDLHGDFTATREILRLTGLIDPADGWQGGRDRLVQVGDILDRGDEEREIIDLLERLAAEAAAAGGAVHVLNGNHELMQAGKRYLYVTPDGFRDFAEFDDGDPSLRIFPKERRGRYAAFRPGGPYAKKLADNPVVLVLDGTIFVHGGLLPKHLDVGIETINARARAFMLGHDDAFWGWLADWDSPVMSRHYAHQPSAGDCYLLDQTLKRTGARRMVVGHSPQARGITGYCEDRVWAIDANLSKPAGNRREALEIRGDEVRPLRFPPGPPPPPPR